MLCSMHFVTLCSWHYVRLCGGHCVVLCNKHSVTLSGRHCVTPCCWCSVGAAHLAIYPDVQQFPCDIMHLPFFMSCRWHSVTLCKVHFLKRCSMHSVMLSCKRCVALCSCLS